MKNEMFYINTVTDDETGVVIEYGLSNHPEIKSRIFIERDQIFSDESHLNKLNDPIDCRYNLHLSDVICELDGWFDTSRGIDLDRDDYLDLGDNLFLKIYLDRREELGLDDESGDDEDYYYSIDRILGNLSYKGLRKIRNMIIHIGVMVRDHYYE